MEVIEIFPTPLFVTNIVITDEERKFVYENKSNTYPNQFYNVTSVDKNILDNSTLLNLRNQIDRYLKEYINNVLGQDALLKITQSWINYNPKGSSHHTHNHFNSIISGVIYFSDDPAELVFIRESKNMMVPNILKPTKYNASSYKLNTRNNMLVLFPSEMKHGVNKNDTDTVRVSLAFNTFFTGTIGDDSALTKLELN